MTRQSREGEKTLEGDQLVDGADVTNFVHYAGAAIGAGGIAGKPVREK